MRVTRAQLLKVMPNARKRVDKYLPYFNELAEKYHIDTKLRWAHFLAQIAHESGELRYTKELASGKAYEGRKDLGNTQQGDGVKYKGRGFIQLTGRSNYSKFQSYSMQPVLEKPELLEEPELCVDVTMWFWETHGLNVLAEQDNLKAIRKRINGGYNGLAECEKYLKRAKEAMEIRMLAQ
nr:MAG TPA: Chitinase A [Caudoviricetes sp.]